MKIFVDTASVKEIRDAQSWGILDGVTTNPTLLAGEGQDPRRVVDQICAIVSGPVNVEVTTLAADEMVKEGAEAASWAPNIVVKLPMIKEGLKAVKVLSDRGVRTNVTLCFSVPQALLAAKAGAAYVSPFLGRLDDIGHDGMEVVRQAVEIYRTYGYTTQVLAASIRHPRHIVEAARAGAHVATAPFAVIEQLFKHPLTDIGLDRFMDDWRKLQKALEAAQARV
ncbi:MAG: fructose-6-phosphate aldolase [Armatimonadetes bacterium]|nr:fructose-6-phosphate aldolase [Armatimonadota bacterium]